MSQCLAQRRRLEYFQRHEQLEILEEALPVRIVPHLGGSVRDSDATASKDTCDLDVSNR